MIGKEEIKLYASHHQFHFQDSEPLGSTDDEDFWTEQSTKNRLAVTDGILGIGTGSYGFVTVRVEQHDEAPLLELEKWDHVTECSLQIRSRFIFVMGCLSDSGLFFEVTPGSYRVRACHANLDQSELEVPHEWQGDFNDWYLIQFWSSEFMETKILKSRDA